MAYNAYIPSKLNSEIDRFKLNSGSIQLDYRQGNGSAPYLFGTPYILNTDVSYFTFDVAPNKVPTETHQSGDQSNYRRFSTDIILTTDDYQKNTAVLFLNGSLLKVAYSKTTFFEGGLNPETGLIEHTLKHDFSVLESSEDFEETDVKFIKPLSLEFSEELLGFYTKQKVVVIREKPLSVEGFGFYTKDGVDLSADPPVYPVVTFNQTVATPFGADGDIVPVEDVPQDLRDLTYFQVFFVYNESYKTNLHFVCSLSKDGDVLSAPGSSVLSDSLPNYQAYSSSINAPQDIVGLTVNISPSSGALLHTTFSADNRDLLSDYETKIGSSRLMYKNIYTGMLGSPFIVLQFLSTLEGEDLNLKMDGYDDTVLSTSDLTKFYSDFIQTMYERGIVVVPFKNKTFALIKKDTTSEINLEFSSESTLIISRPAFTNLEYLNSTLKLTFNEEQHPINSSFSHIEYLLGEGEVSANITYKGVLKESLDDFTLYFKPQARLVVDSSLVTSGEYTVKLNVEGLSEVKTISVQLDSTNTAAEIIDKLVLALSKPDVLEGKFFTKKYRDKSYFDIINKQEGSVFQFSIEASDVIKYDNSLNQTWFNSVGGEKVTFLTGRSNDFIELSCEATINSNGTIISGIASPNTILVIRDALGADVLQRTIPNNGLFTVTLSNPVTDGAKIYALCIDTDGNESEAVELIGTRDTTPPAEPTEIQFSTDGLTITGKTEPSASVRIMNMTDQVLSTVTANSEGEFTVTLTEPVLDLESLKVILTDTSNNSSTVFVIQRS